MIESKDLTIGNTVMDHYGDIGKISLVAPNYVYMTITTEVTRGNDEISGVVLTEEVLRQYGMKIHDLDGLPNPFLMNEIGAFKNSEQLKYVISSDDDSHGGWSYYTKDIKYLHELENLISLLGEEELRKKK